MSIQLDVPVVRLGRTVVPAESLLTMRAFAHDLQSGRGALGRVGRHFRLGVWLCGAGFIGFGDGWDVVDDSVLTSLLGWPGVS